ncbi:MAG: hypothetical protein IPL40_16410 [Proteobacteria bacterium]|nr:hypothetical protein [Pseudomonadota bacterium]
MIRARAVLARLGVGAAGARLLCGALVVAFAGACASEERGTPPPRDTIYFPSGLLLDWARDATTGEADRRRPRLLVTNANADLRYSSGTLTALDLRALPDDVSATAAAVAEQALRCAPDAIELDRWQCPAEQFVVPSATLRLGDFPGELRLHELAGSRRVLIPVRGQSQLIWAEIVDLPDGGVDLRCHDGVSAGCGGIGRDVDCPIWECDAAHRVATSERTDAAIPPEPFGIEVNPAVAVHLAADGSRRTCHDGIRPAPSCACPPEAACAAGQTSSCCEAPPADLAHVYLTHLEGGEVSVLASSAAGVVLQDERSGFFGGTTPVGGGYGIAISRPGDLEARVWVSSRFDSTLSSFVVRDTRRLIMTERLAPAVLDPGNDLRGLAFGPGAEVLYVVSQQPSALIALQMEATPGAPSTSTGIGQTLWIADLCVGPSALTLGPNPVDLDDAAAQLAYVTCFAEDTIAVVDLTHGTLVGQIATGRGPTTLALDVGSMQACVAAADCPDVGARCAGGRCLREHARAFVSNFLENTVGLIDLDPLHSTFQRMVLRLGTRRDLVGDL